MGSSGDGSRPTPACARHRREGKKTGPTPTDRAKSGTQRHVLTEAGGVPVALAASAANEHDKWGLGALLDSRLVRPECGTEQHLFLYKGYDYEDTRCDVERRRYVPHVRSRGEERRRCKRGEKPRRWVVERTHSWFNRFRKPLIRRQGLTGDLFASFAAAVA
jgi:putative transposase